MLRCGDCDLVYDVVWNLDAAGQGPGGWKPVSYCPRCGSTDVILPPPEPETTEGND